MLFCFTIDKAKVFVSILVPSFSSIYTSCWADDCNERIAMHQRHPMNWEGFSSRRRRPTVQGNCNDPVLERGLGQTERIHGKGGLGRFRVGRLSEIARWFHALGFEKFPPANSRGNFTYVFIYRDYQFQYFSWLNCWVLLLANQSKVGATKSAIEMGLKQP